MTLEVIPETTPGAGIEKAVGWAMIATE